MMQLKKYKLFCSERVTVLEEDEKKCIVFLNRENKYYRVDTNFGKLGIVNFTVKEYHLETFDLIVYSLIAIVPLLLICSAIMCYDSRALEFIFNMREIIISLFSLVCNILMHETAHILAMKIYSLPCSAIQVRKGKTFLKFFVDTSAAYLLPPYKRIVVFSAGILSNFYFIFGMVIVGTLCSRSMLAAVFPPAVLILLNVFPFIDKYTDLHYVYSSILEL